MKTPLPLADLFRDSILVFLTTILVFFGWVQYGSTVGAYSIGYAFLVTAVFMVIFALFYRSRT